MNPFANFLSSGSKVHIAGNERLEGKPLVTPFLDDAGNPKTDLNLRPIGSMMLTQVKRTLNGTFINASRRVAFLSGTVEELNTIIKQNNLKDNSEVPGTIVIKESLTPFWPNQTSKINPNDPDTPIGFTVGGTFYPVYMQQSYSPVETTPDVLIRSVDDAIAWLNARQSNVEVQNQQQQAGEHAAVPAQ